MWTKHMTDVKKLPHSGATARRRGKARRSLDLIEASRAILTEIHLASVRAVCYQLFTRKMLASMARNATNNVSRLLRDAREAGTIPWYGGEVDVRRLAIAENEGSRPMSARIKRFIVSALAVLPVWTWRHTSAAVRCVWRGFAGA
jgi:hypothetical protein